MGYIGGGFSDGGFSSGFNIGTLVSDDDTVAPPDRYTLDMVRFIEQVRREDEEILAIILATAASGILDE